jgi:putative addiction module component (TIGR02574 family)
MREKEQAMARPTLEELKKLSVEERLQLLEDVWTSLDEDHPHPMPMPKWHEEELDRRLKAFEENPGAGEPWEEVRKRLMARG